MRCQRGRVLRIGVREERLGARLSEVVGRCFELRPAGHGSEVGEVRVGVVNRLLSESDVVGFFGRREEARQVGRVEWEVEMLRDSSNCSNEEVELRQVVSSRTQRSSL